MGLIGLASLYVNREKLYISMKAAQLESGSSPHSSFSDREGRAGEAGHNFVANSGDRVSRHIMFIEMRTPS